MNYINPYELLGINSANLSDINNKTILKEKKKLFQEIELSDSDSVEHNGMELTKADCLKAIDDLDDKNKREFHFFIFQNKPLNDFLSKGSLTFFEKYQIESIYKLPEFLNFISSYFAAQYDKVLTNNFRKQNIKAVSMILSVKPITNDLLFEACYRGTYSIIKNFDNEITDIAKKIELKQSPFIETNFFGLDSLIKEKVSIELINLLPNYFQSLRNQLAQSIRNLARDINNDPYNLYDPAFKIIEIANGFSTDGLVRQTITKGYYTIKENYEDNLQKQQPTLHNAITVKNTPPLLAEPEVKEKVEQKSGSTNKYYTGFLIVVSAFLVWSLFNNTIQKIILSIASVMYMVWLINNLKGKKDYPKNADNQSLIYVSSLIVCVGGYFYPFLSILFISYCLVLLVHSLYFSLLFKKVSKQEEVFGYVIIASVLAVLFWGYQNKQESGIASLNAQKELSPTNNDNSFNNNSSLPKATDTTVSISYNNPISQNYSTETEPVYTKVSMKNGNISDCFRIYPKYDNKLKTKLIISAELTDVAVKIFNYETDKCIRFVFINDGTTYSVRYIPEGKYYLKIAYGNDWSVKEGDPVCKGHFTSHASFKKDYDVYNFNLKRYDNGDISTPYYTLKLYRTYTLDNSDNSSNSISETDFNNN